jgi:integrase
VASGWRVGEYLPLTWGQVDRASEQIRLTTSKNGEGRVLPIVGPIAAIIERRARDRVVGCPAVFHRGGRPLCEGSFRTAFGRAALRAGLGDLSPHDLRRTAVRDMVHAGVPERVAMGVTGHKTRAVFDRYCIVRPSDLAEAVAKADRRRTQAMVAR